MAVSGTDTPQLCPVLISARPDEFTKSRRLVVTETNTWPSWLLGSTVVATRRTLPSTSPAPMILIRAVWLTASFEISRTGTRPTRSNSLRAMMENSASPLPEAGAPTTAEEAEISPATGACTCTLPPSGSVSRASGWPAVTVSPASARTSATFRPGRSGRTEVSSFGIRMPETSTMLPKHDFAAFSTVTAAPFGPSLGTSGSSAARHGSEARQNSTAAASRFRERPRGGRLVMGVPVLVSGCSISEGRVKSQAAMEIGGARRSFDIGQFAKSGALFGSGHRPRSEQSEIVMNPPVVGPHLGPAARNLQNQPEQVPASLLDRGFAGGDAAGVEIDQVLPAAREFGSCRHLDDGCCGEPIGGAAPRREHL